MAPPTLPRPPQVTVATVSPGLLPPPAPVSSAFQAGQRIHQYELIRELGRGGMGEVWAARDTKLGRRVAIKLVRTGSRVDVDKFLAEARATAQCDHEHIVIIHAVDELDGQPYMVLEYLEGATLRADMGPPNSGVRVSSARTVEVGLAVARALARAHALGIVHRDLKPENVFVTKAGQIKVLDFGVAKALGGEGRTDKTRGLAATMMPSTNTQDGAITGTLPYMSPEQLGMDIVDHRTDLWALGIMMFEMLAGRHPLDSPSPHMLIANAGSADPMPSIAHFVPDIPPQLARLVDACLVKTKTGRIARAEDLIAALEPLLPGRRGRALADGESPYPGLAAFQATDANRFFGRERDIARMVARLRERPLTAVIGPSGVGKSSFVRAGVGPALEASGEAWDVVTLRPGRDPIQALATVAARLTTHGGTQLNNELSRYDELMRRLAHEPGYLGTLLRARALATGSRILLFVDQLEELYTLVPDLATRRAFTAALAGVADDATTPLRVVVSMRADFLDRVAEDPRFMDELGHGLVFLAAPTPDGLREALVQPLEMTQYRFETPAIVDDMLGVLAHTAGALPLLQFAAAKLWEARDRSRRVLTEDSYRAIGGITGALASHADEVVVRMNAAQQQLTQRVFRRLVTPERTRAIVELADLEQLAGGAELRRVIEQLVAARLVVVQTRGDGGGGTAEIVHESLIERWPTLRRWLDDDHEDAAFVAELAAAAKQWEARGRPAGLVWRGEAADYAQRWLAARPRQLAARDRAFVDATLALARRSKRLRRTALVAAFTVLGVIAAGASVAVVSIRSAEQEALADQQAAERSAKDAHAALAEKERQEKLAAEAAAQKAAAEKAREAESARAQVAEAAKADADKQVEADAAELAAKNQKLEEALAAAQRATAAQKATSDQLAAANKVLQKQLDEAAKQRKTLSKGSDLH